MALYLLILGFGFMFLETSVNDYEANEISKFKFDEEKFYGDKKRIIFIIEDMNRLKIDQQRIFFNEINFYFDKLKYNNKKIIFLFDKNLYPDNGHEDLTKFLEFELFIVNDRRTTEWIIKDILNKSKIIKNKEKILEILNNVKAEDRWRRTESYYDIICNHTKSHNVRTLMSILEKIDFYLNYKDFMKMAFIKDVLDFVLLEFLENDLYKEIIAKPSIIFSNKTTTIDKSAQSDMDVYIATPFGKKILDEEYEWRSFKKKYMWYSQTIFLKQMPIPEPYYLNSSSYQSNVNIEATNAYTLRISNQDDFFFFKYPERFIEYKEKIKVIENNLTTNINMEYLVDAFDEGNSLMSEFEEVKMHTCLNIIMSSENADLNNKVSFENILNQLLKLRFGTKRIWNSSSYDVIADLLNYFGKFYKEFVVEKLIFLMKKNKKNWKIEDYQFACLISEEMRMAIRNNGTINQILHVDNKNNTLGLDEADYGNSLRIRERIEEIGNFYLQYSIETLINNTYYPGNKIYDIELDSLLKDIYNLSPNNWQKFIMNILHLDYRGCRLLIISTYKSKEYGKEIKSTLENLSKDTDLFKMISLKGEYGYKLVSNYKKNELGWIGNDLDDSTNKFYKEFEKFFK